MEYKSKQEMLNEIMANDPHELGRPHMHVLIQQWGEQEYAKGMAAVNLYETVRAVGSRIKDDRDQYTVLASATEELGELAQEIRIANGHSYKEEGKDGIVGEAIDVIACALDLIYITNPNITCSELNDMLAKKCAKWLSNTEELFIID
jgi:NTP pyrophosphatase (non-canonical NTP hydrolase)